MNKNVNIGLLIPDTLPHIIREIVDIGLLRTDNLPLIVVEDTLVEADIGHKMTATIPLAIG